MHFHIFRNKLNKFKRDSNGFGLTESIISIVLLSVIISYSIVFVTKRQTALYESNLTAAINDEINRDIEAIKNDLWNHHYVPKKGLVPARYDIGGIYCGDVINTIKFFTTPEYSWTPGINVGDYKGQKRNKIFTGRPVKITRKIISKSPLDLGTRSTMDYSIAKIVYIVNRDNQEIYWTGLDLTSEAHSWCSQN